MSAGRPHNSTTPIWRNNAAIKVRIYRWMKSGSGTKMGCARDMEMTRTTVIKRWDTMEWTAEKLDNFQKVGAWYIHSKDREDLGLCAIELGLPIEDVFLDVATWKEMIPKYMI